MIPSELKLNRVERLIFGFALAIGVLLVLVRVGTFLSLWFSQHAR